MDFLRWATGHPERTVEPWWMTVLAWLVIVWFVARVLLGGRRD